MRDINTMGRLEYVLTNIFWSIVIMLWYRALLFMPLDECTVGYSKKVLWITVMVFILAGIFITFKRRRNIFTCIVNILLPYQAYAVVTYWGYFGLWIKIVLAISIVFSLGFFISVVFRKVRKRENTPRNIVEKRIKHGLLGMRSIVAICLCFFVIPLSVNTLLGRNLYETDGGDTVVLSEANQWTIKKNIDTVKNLKPEIWKTMTPDSKLDTLAIIKNIEITYLGVNHEVNLVADRLNEGVLGCYVPNERKIIIDMEHLKNGKVDEVLHTLIHECHHAYTRQLVEVYKQLPEEYKSMIIFEEAKIYEREYADYDSGDDDYFSYATQSCEADANLYAGQAMQDYYKRIFEYELEDVA